MGHLCGWIFHDWESILANRLYRLQENHPPVETREILTCNSLDMLIDELIAFCREALAGYKIPRRYSWLEELPRNPSGKVLKRVLRDQFADVSAE